MSTVVRGKSIEDHTFLCLARIGNIVSRGSNYGLVVSHRLVVKYLG